MQRSTKHITLVLIGAAALLPGCKKSPVQSEGNRSGQTTGTRTRGGMLYYGGRMRPNPGYAPVAGAAGGNVQQAVDTNTRVKSGFGSTGRSRGGGWFS